MKDRIQSFLSGKDHENRKKSEQDRLFSPDYVEFDDFGHVTVKCMRCGTPISSRAELPSKDAGVRVIGMKKNAAYRQVGRPGHAAILCCAQCEPLLQNLTEEEADRVESVQMHGWVSGMVWAGKGDEHIKAFINKARKEK